MLNTNPELDKSASGYFRLIIPKLPVPNTLEREMVLNIFGTVVPGFNISSNSVDWMGGTVQTPVSRPNFENWHFNFMVDENLENWKLFYDWMMFINNNNDQFVQYFPDYCVDFTLKVLDNFKIPILSLKFRNCWPTNLGDLELDGSNVDRVLKCRVQIAYDRYEYDSGDK